MEHLVTFLKEQIGGADQCEADEGLTTAERVRVVSPSEKGGQCTGTKNMEPLVEMTKGTGGSAVVDTYEEHAP
jgi:hypothetical protein